MTFPSTAQYVPVTMGGMPAVDPVRDVSPDETDIVGNTQFPAAYYAYDGTNVYFRMRLNADPRFKTGFTNFAWGVLFNTDGNESTYEWELVVNGLDNRLDLIRNTSSIPNSFNDQAEGIDGRGTPNFSIPIINFDIVRVQGTADGSQLGNSTNYFLDILIPAPTLFSTLGITDQTQLRLLFFTATNNNNLNKDFMGTGQILSTLFSDPLTISGGDVRAKLSLVQTSSVEPAPLLAGQQSVISGSITITNTGRSSASLVVVNSTFPVDRLISLTVTSSPIGQTVFSKLASTLTWNVGTLLAGQSATLQYRLALVFTTSGTRLIDTKAAAGVDLFTGGGIGASSTASVEVTAFGGVTGTILDKTTGLPLTGVGVQATNTQNNAVVATGTTGEGGVFGFPTLPAGTYSLQFTFPNYNSLTVQVTVIAGQIITVNTTLAPLPAIAQGTVLDAQTSIGIAGAAVYLTDWLGVQVAQTFTDAAGNYSLSLNPGYYRISLSASGYQLVNKPLTLTAGEVGGVNAALQPNPGSLTGTVTDVISGISVTGAQIEVLDNRNNVLATAFTDSSGVYSFNSLAPSTNDRVRISAPAYVTAVIGFRINSGQTTIVNVPLTPVAGAITGIVTDSTSGLPLAGASLRVYNSEAITLQTTNTAVDGSYTLESLAPGSLTVVVAEEGYASRTIGAVVQASTVTALNVSLDQLAGAVTGVVWDTAGNPITDVNIRIFLNNIIVGRVATGEDGFYFIGNLAPNVYSLTTRAEGYGGQSFSVDISPGETEVADFTLLSDFGTLTGVVTDTSGNPLSGTAITLNVNVASGGLIVTRYVTQIDGSYFISNLFPGPYLVNAALNGFQNEFLGVTVNAGEQARANFVLESNPGMISGVVRAEDGSPIAGASVVIKSSGGSGLTVATVFTDANGIFSSPNLASGNYTAGASVTGFQSGFATVEVQAGLTTDAAIILSQNPGSIQGQVTDAVTGLPIFGIIATVTNDSNFIVSSQLSDNESQFRFDGLSPGSYTVTVRALNFQSGLLGAVVKPDAITTTIFALEPEPGILIGQVSPAIGGALIEYYNNNNVLISSTVTDINGRFSFLGEQPGSYYLTATTQGYSSQVTAATVLAGQTTDVTIPLSANPGSVAGIVVDLEGNPIPTAFVKVYDGNESIRGVSAVLADGRFTIPSIPPGTENVIATAPNYSNDIQGVRIGLGEMVAGLRFVLRPDPGTVSGQIVDAISGVALLGADVELRIGDAAGLSVSSMATTMSGDYQFFGLQPGSYTIIARAPGYGVDAIGAVIVSNSETIANLALVPSVGSIHGTVVNSEQSVITGQTEVKVFTNTGVLTETVFIDSSGGFTVPNVKPGEYILVVTSPGFESLQQSVAVLAGAALHLILTLQPQTTTLNGNTVDAATQQGITGALIQVSNVNGIPVDSAYSDQTGSFTLTGIPAGNYVVTGSAFNYGSDTEAVVTSAGQSSQVLLELSPHPGRLSGLVSDVRTGANLEGAIIQLTVETNGALVATIVSGAGGLFSIGTLAPGRYALSASADGYAYEFGSCTVASGQETRFSFALEPLPGRLIGFVRSAVSGAVISESVVRLLQYDNFGPILESTLTDSSGRFEISMVDAANYTITAGRIGFVTSQTSVLIGRAETVTVELLLRPSLTTLVGTVRSTAGGGLPNASVVVVDPNGVTNGEGITSQDGRYFVPSAAGGEQLLVVNAGQEGTRTVQLNQSPGQQSQVDVTLQGPFFSVTGTVMDEVNLSPVPGAIVHVLADSLNVIVNTVYADGVGQFVSAGYSNGSYTLSISAPDFGSVALPAAVSGGLSNVIVRLPVLFGTLRGTIRDAGGHPLYLALAEIVTADGLLIRQTISNRSGQYGFTNVAAGQPYVRFSFPGKENVLVRPVIVNGQTTILDIILLDEEEE
ncbi:carboxypeptidase regulatory-like domain-containing protein [Paenibacillus lautus]|uniref:carboxypeptidase regulatory-like domain-containing protein n=1 Tax=Paenibacillus lautus TaxID=1401 RepID=UPI002FBDFD15